MNLRFMLLAVVSIVLSASAQVCFKLGMSRPSVQKGLSGLGTEQLWQGLAPIVFNPGILGGFFLYGLSAVLWLFVLARLDLSVAYPFVGLGFVLTMLAGAFLFNEPMSALRIAGAILIFAGVALVAQTQR